MESQTTRRGVTLIEILVVLAIVIILAGVASILFRRLDVAGKEKALQNTFVLLDSALEEYHSEVRAFPVQSVPVTQGANPAARRTLAAQHSQFMVRALMTEPSGREILDRIQGASRRNGYLPEPNDAIPEIYDPWETPIDYLCATADGLPVLRSAGPDRDFGTRDDITDR